MLTQEIENAIKIAKTTKPQVIDVYREKKADKEIKGINAQGNEIWGYVYSPDLFVKSDVTGRMCRFYIQVGNVVFHPDELASAKVAKDGTVTVQQIEKISVSDPLEGRKQSYHTFKDAINSTVRYLKAYSQDELDNHSITIEDKTTGQSMTMSRQEWMCIRNKMSNRFYGLTFPTFSQFIEMMAD